MRDTAAATSFCRCIGSLCILTFSLRLLVVRNWEVGPKASRTVPQT